MDISNLTLDEKAVFLKLQSGDPLTKNNLLHSLGFKPSTLNRIITSLVEKGAIIEAGLDDSSGGRKPSLFCVNTAEKLIVGIDISISYSAVVLCDLTMKPIASEMVYVTPTFYSPDNVFSKLENTIDKLLNENNLTRKNILGIGIGAVGPVNRDCGLMCDSDQSIFKYHDWRHFAVREAFERSFGCKVYVDNGAVAAIIGEYLFGVGRNYSSVAYFNCEIDIRSANLVNGVVIRAPHNNENAFSHTSINIIGEKCFCGKRGCLRNFTSTQVISDNLKRRISMGESSKIDVAPKDINYLVYKDAALKGDSMSIDELRQAGFYMGCALGNYITMLNPKLVIIDGPLVTDITHFYDVAVYTAKQCSYNFGADDVVYRRGGSFGGMSIAIGAAASFSAYYFNESIVN